MYLHEWIAHFFASPSFTTTIGSHDSARYTEAKAKLTDEPEEPVDGWMFGSMAEDPFVSCHGLVNQKNTSESFLSQMGQQKNSRMVTFSRTPLGVCPSRMSSIWFHPG